MLLPGNKQHFFSDRVRSCWPEKASLLHDPCHAQALNSLFLFARLFFS